MAEDPRPGVATNSQNQQKEEKALSLTTRFRFRISIHPAGSRETLLPRPILSGPSRLAIDTDWQSVCLEFESSGRGPLLLANRESLSDSNLSRSEERRVEKECRSRWSPYH